MSEAPEIIFIVPYRNREMHLEHFKKQMKIVMEVHVYSSV